MRRPSRGVPEGSASELREVPLQIGGQRCLAHVSIDAAEHHRRQTMHLGAVVDRTLLEALWELPGGLPVPEAALVRSDAMILAALGSGLVERADGILCRSFRPAATIHLAFTTAPSASAAIIRLTNVPRVYPRLAICQRPAPPAAVELARRRRVGLAERCNRRLSVLVEPPTPALGAPGVDRWWMSELAYAAWLDATPAPPERLN
jgi:hypothetical protein